MEFARYKCLLEILLMNAIVAELFKHVRDTSKLQYLYFAAILITFNLSLTSLAFLNSFGFLEGSCCFCLVKRVGSLTLFISDDCVCLD